MTLKDINKAVYRKNLNRVIIGFVASFALLGVGFGQLLILFFSLPEADNFKYNLTGVLLALALCGVVLNSVKNNRFFNEIYYVWQLKQCQNRIYRSLKKVKQARDNNETDAFELLYFYYKSLIQVYTLDDNTITLTEINKELATLQEKAVTLNIELGEPKFDDNMLKTIKNDK